MRIVDCPRYCLDEVDAVVIEPSLTTEVDVKIGRRVRGPSHVFFFHVAYRDVEEIDLLQDRRNLFVCSHLFDCGVKTVVINEETLRFVAVLNNISEREDTERSKAEKPTAGRLTCSDCADDGPLCRQ